MTLDETVQSVLNRHGYKRRSLGELAAMWTFFVQQCLEGYDWTIYEFDDEIAVRDYIDALLVDPVVGSFSEFDGFAQQIRADDELYKSLLQQGVRRPSTDETWWSTGVLKFAGDEYCSGMSSRYSIAVEPFDPDSEVED